MMLQILEIIEKRQPLIFHKRGDRSRPFDQRLLKGAVSDQKEADQYEKNGDDFK